MPQGANAERQHEYDKLKKDFKHDGRYKGREEEVAARIVNKQRTQYSETKAEKAKDRKHESPDEGLPVNHYDHLTAGEIGEELETLSDKDVRKLKGYEEKHKNRKTLIAQYDKALESDLTQKPRGKLRKRLLYEGACSSAVGGRR
ncbi:MAG: hypothetical protein H7X91_08320 [Burkholderiales bacterium]|nr:hypothetical protein [Burkholderiales bacterium]